MKETTKASYAFQKALEVDSKCQVHYSFITYYSVYFKRMYETICKFYFFVLNILIFEMQEAIDGYRKAAMMDSSNPEEIRKRAMQNPEVQEILADPAMQLILQQMQKDPKALQEWVKY